MAKFRAGRSLPAKTGKDNNNNTAVITTAHPNKASFVPQNNKRLSCTVQYSTVQYIINTLLTTIYINVVTLI